MGADISAYDFVGKLSLSTAAEGSAKKLRGFSDK